MFIFLQNRLFLRLECVDLVHESWRTQMKIQNEMNIFEDEERKQFNFREK